MFMCAPPFYNDLFYPIHIPPHPPPPHLALTLAFPHLSLSSIYIHTYPLTLSLPFLTVIMIIDFHLFSILSSRAALYTVQCLIHTRLHIHYCIYLCIPEAEFLDVIGTKVWIYFDSLSFLNLFFAHFKNKIWPMGNKFCVCLAVNQFYSHWSLTGRKSSVIVSTQ